MANPAQYYIIATSSLRTVQSYETLDEAHRIARQEVTDGYGPRTIVVSVQEEIIGVVVTNKHDAPADVFGTSATPVVPGNPVQAAPNARTEQETASCAESEVVTSRVPINAGI